MVTFYARPADQLQAMKLSERQIDVLKYVLEKGRITNTNVQQMFKTSRVTVLRIFNSLEQYLELEGGKGRESFYVMRENY